MGQETVPHASAERAGEPGAAPVDRRVIAAALRCYAQYGVSKTTIEDVAAEAGCSRATLYRYFPGKQALLTAVVDTELRRFAAQIDDAAAGADALEDLAVAVLACAGREFASNDALRHVLAVEPEVVLPHFAFDRGNRVLAVASMMLTPHLSRFLRPDVAARTGEWLGRLAFTYFLTPSDHVSLDDEASVRRLVRAFVMPGLQTEAAVPTA